VNKNYYDIIETVVGYRVRRSLPRRSAHTEENLSWAAWRTGGQDDKLQSHRCLGIVSRDRDTQCIR